MTRALQELSYLALGVEDDLEGEARQEREDEGDEPS
ncbi:MAG: hypothetical protein JWO74_3000 [Solirubrobacterales bacterium]|jgi:hypothetical protein|nr:hypothetical protein [Solirubrobacterales bacterium]